ncbi:glycosyltransferase [Aliarcobacter butzleri]|uniref:Beta-monoglucosyldiacylglycerol synthase n=2 Tax=Aliarcobacter butzleri TaxID=28197 RepID=A0AAW7QCZ4_9BACT|nr:glycosyltransferase family 2 protein [Aliarcobacter butzleri]MCG3681649.1 glycosyltransferase [Aliarcobacter butzleri]MDN5107422.1 glycosyltransferase [Aliarcobacter butzleri]MDN5123963.1 glycosyltransferase [Aliarcobacter butzleri]
MRYIVLGLIMAGLFQVFFWLTQDNLITLKEDSFEKIESLSYSPYEGYNKNLLSKQQIYDDVNMLENFTNKLRTYATLEANAVLEATPDSNMPIDLGLWISGDHEQNHLEIKRAIKLLEKYPNRINSVIVGNEVLLRADLDEVELFAYVDFMRQFTKKPITVAETWDVWERVPDLAKHVDFLTIHILPYWEKIPIDRFNEFIIEKYSLVEKIHPNRKIVIGETGWPSHGYNNRSAVPSLKNQAMAIRGFVNLANEHGWHYNIIEAFDQQWKGYDEGNVGQYWGIFTSDRALKFQLNGDIELNQYWLYQMIAATIIGAIITLLGLRNQRVNISHALAYAVTAQGMAFGIVMAAIYPFINYMNFGMWVMWGMGTFLMIPLVIITLAKANELFRSSIGVPPSRLVPLDLKSQNAPLVSIHVPAYKEEPHVLEETLRSLSQLKYPNYEVLVIINNTPEEYYWKPIEKLCEELGDKFVFMNITCTGFKAGALNAALERTSKDAEIVAVIDADYKVESPWLVDLVPLFDDPKVAIVQAPQDHRDGKESIMKAAMNAEYAGFFDIGMVDRNEENAIVVHGTMVMVRLSAMMEVGGWGTDTIVEDSELGLRLFEAGYIAHYTNRRYGYGLLPDTLEAFKTQRHRWAYGAIQILKKHWREFKPSANRLTPRQKNKFVTGWFFWLSDAMGPIMAVMNIIWVPVIIFVGVTIPTIPLTIPIITAFLVNILHTFILYRTKVKATFKEILLSSIASMSLQLIIFKAVFDGFIKDGLPFKRTQKGGKAKKSANPIKYESILAILLLIAFFALIFTNKTGITEIYVFAVTIFIQSIPYLSAIIMRMLEVYSIKHQKS